MPLVSVVLPIHNAQAYLGEALDSILQQTLGDFELILIDDGSTDASSHIIRGYEARDGRIRTFRQDNLGLPATLNRGIEVATGDYIARMDADDVSRPDRLERQVEFLAAHPEIGLCGSWVQIIGSSSAEIWRYPVTDDAIRSQLIFNAPLAHPAVVIRRGLLKEVGGYRVDFQAAEDYDLWSRLADRTHFANLPQTLLSRRLHKSQKSEHEWNNGSMASAISRIHEMYFLRLGLNYQPVDIELHAAIGASQLRADREFVSLAADWLGKLSCANAVSQVFPTSAFPQVLAERWWAVCHAARSLGMWTWQRFRRLPLSSAASIPRRQMLRFALTCLRYQLA